MWQVMLTAGANGGIITKILTTKSNSYGDMEFKTISNTDCAPVNFEVTRAFIMLVCYIEVFER